jgi:hypothetical protein
MLLCFALKDIAGSELYIERLLQGLNCIYNIYHEVCVYLYINICTFMNFVDTVCIKHSNINYLY